MNRGIAKLAFRESWPAAAIFCLGICALQASLAAIVPSFQDDVTEIISRLKFVQQIFAALLGTDPESTIGPAALAAMPWTHPIVLAIVWTHAIMQFTRYPAGEIDRGTIDWTSALPVRRWTAYCTHSVISVGSGVLLIAAGFVGNMIGVLFAGPVEGLTLAVRIRINANLLVLFLAVGGVAMLFAACSNRRGRAAGAALAILLASFLVNVLSTFNTVIRRVDFLGILTYYRPMQIMTGDAWPSRDLLVLGAIAAVCWIAGAMVFTRRDIRTV